MEAYIREGFLETLMHWCHPHGDDAHMYMSNDEYNQAAEDYYNEIVSDPKKFDEDWGEDVEEYFNICSEKFPGTTKEKVKEVLLKYLDEHLN
jgi:hypothetical protein